MKSFFLFGLMIIACSTNAQDSTYRLRAVGVDVFKNLPFEILYRYSVASSYPQTSNFYHPRIIELYGQVSTPKPGTLWNIGLGYAAMEHLYQQRLRQNIQGYYLKVGREFSWSVSPPCEEFLGV
ncbi:MAG: hypothetical protein R2822_11290 [Spirosomataceae bacterium]